MNFFQKYSKWIVAFVFACAVIFVYKTFDNLSSIFSVIGTVFKAFAPFFWGFVIAYIINMPISRLDKLIKKTKNTALKKHSYTISVVISYVLAFAIVVFSVATIIPAISKNVVEIYNNLPAHIKALENYINDLAIIKNLNLADGRLDIYTTLYDIFSEIDISAVGKYAQGIASVTLGVFDVFVAIISSIYMIIDKERLLEFFKRLLQTIFKTKTVDSLLEHASRINTIFTNYIYSRIICGVITGIVSGICLTILQIKYAFLLAIIIMVLDIIPYFGSIISTVISAVIALITGGLWKMLWTLITLLIIQQLDGNVLAPKVMGETLEIRPLWIILAVSVGSTLFGFLGMVISVPVIAVIKATVAEVWEYMETEKDREIQSDNKEGTNDE